MAPVREARRTGTREAAWYARALERLLPSLARWAHGRLPPRARGRLETADLVQEAALGVVVHFGGRELRDSSQLESYLRQSIRHRIIDEIRRADCVDMGAELTDDGARDREPTPLEGAIVAEERRRFRAALRRLSEDEQILIVGRVDLELSYSDLAAATGRPSSDAARVATRRAVLKLAEEVGR